MKKFVTPVVFVLVIAMLTAFVIGQIGARRDDVNFTDVTKNTKVEKASEAEVAKEEDTAEEGAETVAAQEETEVIAPAREPYKLPLTSVLDDVDVAEYNLKTFAGIVTKAKLEGLMTPEDGGQLTVFLPTDTGFGYMTEEARQALVDGDFATADAFLKAHLVAGRYTLSEINAKAKDNTLTVTTLANTKIKLVREEGGPWAIETADGLRFIMRPDLSRANGVGQVIDAVLPSK